MLVSFLKDDIYLSKYFIFNLSNTEYPDTEYPDTEYPDTEYPDIVYFAANGL